MGHLQMTLKNIRNFMLINMNRKKMYISGHRANDVLWLIIVLSKYEMAENGQYKSIFKILCIFFLNARNSNFSEKLPSNILL